jgi:CRP/FNR family cyclic AMP-dependent transcriptional regulator
MSTTPTSALFEALPSAELRSLAQLGAVRTYPKQTVIIQEGDASDTLYIMLAGRVRVYSAAEDGREIVLDFLEAGDVVGEMVLDGSTRSASVMTVEQSTFSVLPQATLRARLKTDDDLAMLLITSLIQRLRKTSHSVKQLALADVYQRMSEVLGDEARKSSVPDVIEGLTQQDIADRVGASRDMINRIFKELIVGGYVEVARRRITLLKALPARW